MTKKLIALLMCLAMVLSLTACGGNGPGEGEADCQLPDSDVTSNDSVINDAAGNTVNDTADDVQDAQQDAPAEENTDSETAVPTLNRLDFTLKNVGDSFRLEVENLPEGAAVTWSVSDEAVATLAEDGTVTAVAHGTATVVAVIEGSDAALSCIVRVTAQSESAGGKDLASFYNAVISKYELPMMMLLEDEELLDHFFPGLTAVPCNQRGVYFNMMSVNNGEMAMAEAAEAADVEAIKAAFQSRVDDMIESSMFYAESNEIWTNQSRVVSVGNYVIMVASPNCDAIVDDFKAFVK